MHAMYRFLESRAKKQGGAAGIAGHQLITVTVAMAVGDVSMHNDRTSEQTSDLGQATIERARNMS